MQISFNSSVLFVNNITKSKLFYQGFLNQEIKYDFGKNIAFQSGLAIWEINPEHIIPQKLGNKVLTQENRFELYFETDDLDLIIAKLRLNDIEFLHDIHEEVWGQRTIRFFDPDRHLIEVGEKMESFIKRLYDNGLNIEQIATKSSVPIDLVKELIV